MKRAADAAEEVADFKSTLQEHSYERVGHSALGVVKGCVRGVRGYVYDIHCCVCEWVWASCAMRHCECEATFWRSKRNQM